MLESLGYLRFVRKLREIKKGKFYRIRKTPHDFINLPLLRLLWNVYILSNLCPYLAVFFPESFVHFPYEFRARRAHKFANVKQIDDIVGSQHLGTLADWRCARLEFGEHGAGSGRRRRQTAAPPEVWPTYFVGCSSGLRRRLDADCCGCTGSWESKCSTANQLRCWKK